MTAQLKPVNLWTVADLVAAFDYMSRELTNKTFYAHSLEVITKELNDRIDFVQ